MLQVDAAQRFHDLLGHPVGQNPGKGARRQEDKHHRRDHATHEEQHRALRHGETQHRAVLHPLGVIESMLRQGGRAADTGAGLVFQRLLHLCPVGVVFHSAGVAAVVEFYRAVCLDPGDAALAGRHLVQILHAVLFHALLHKGCRGAHLIQHGRFKVFVEYAGDECQAQQQHRHHHGDHGLKDLSGHALPSPER